MNFPGTNKPSLDLIVGCIDHYDFAKIEPWVNSAVNCGFAGDIALFCYNINQETIARLGSLGILTYAHNSDQAGNAYFNSPRAIVVQRFFDLWNASRNLRWATKYRYVIATDVKDVIFQRNPSEFLESWAADRKLINVGSECLLYRDEPWGNQNMFDSYGPQVHNHMLQKCIYNCGTLSGSAEAMQDLFLNIFLMSNNNPVHNPDQAALNVILSMKPWADITRFNRMQSGYACQAGTTNDPSKIDAFRPNLLESEQPFLDVNDGLVKYNEPYMKVPTPFYLVHQYDRIPSWKKIIESKYRF